MSLFGNAFKYNLALDLGSQNIRACINSTDVIRVASLLVRVEGGRESLGTKELVGAAAERVFEQINTHGHSPLSNSVVLYPIRRGAVSSVEITERVLRHLFRGIQGRPFSTRPNVLCGVAAHSTPVEMQNIVEAIMQAGAKRAELVSGPAAVCIQHSIETNTKKSTARIVVELGAETIGLGIASSSGVLTSSRLPFGMQEFIAAAFGYLTRTEANTTKHSATQRLLESDVRNADFAPALLPLLRMIADEIKELLARAPEMLLDELMRESVVLSGAPAELKGLREFLAEELNMGVVVADNPQSIRVRGLASIMADGELLDRLVLGEY